MVADGGHRKQLVADLNIESIIPLLTASREFFDDCKHFSEQVAEQFQNINVRCSCSF